jgi:hypothetical protein
MFVVEFLGAPDSGKTFYRDRIILEKSLNIYNIYNYRDFFLCNLKEKIKLNLFNRLILKYLCIKNRQLRKINKKHQSSFKKNKNNNSIIRKIIFKKINKLIEKQVNSLSINNNKFYNLLKRIFEILDDNERKHNLQRWSYELLASRNIYDHINTKDKLIIDSEGFIHRLNSFLVSKKLNEKLIDEYLNLCPKPDIIVYVNEDIENIKKRILENYNFEQQSNLIDKMEEMHRNSEIIFEKLNKYPIKSFKINYKNFNNIKDQIIEYLVEKKLKL